MKTRHQSRVPVFVMVAALAAGATNLTFALTLDPSPHTVAITLSAGIIVSLYVGVVVTRMMFDLLGAYTNISSIKMLAFVRDTNIDFISKRWIAAGLSALIILGSWAVFIQKGAGNFGVGTHPVVIVGHTLLGWQEWQHGSQRGATHGTE